MTRFDWVVDELQDIAYAIENWDGDNLDQNDVNTLNKAIELVRKQIPQEIRIMDLKYRKQVPFCPQCESDISHFAIDGVRYCPWCGQALDWTEKEEE